MGNNKLNIRIVPATVNGKNYQRLYVNFERVGDFTTLEEVADGIKKHFEQKDKEENEKNITNNQST
jgi:hypothetical protein